MKWETVPLGEVVYPREDVEFVSTPDKETFVTVRLRSGGAVKRTVGEGKTPRPFNGRRIYAGDLIYSRIDARNGAFAIVPPGLHRAVVSKDFPTFRIDGARIDTGFLARLVGNPAFWARFQAMSFGATNRQRIDERLLLGQRIPLPPLPEQRRIAAILDEADALRAKSIERRDAARRASRGRISELIATSTDLRPLAQLLAEPMRNGISPSRGGRHEGEVLTLSAITRGAFDPWQRKSDVFASPHAADKLVTAGLHLVCRGNGNPELVGTMVAATGDVDGVAFPDTMIGFRPSPAINSPTLVAAWQHPTVRDQVRRAARTTNGTYKVNQQTLASVLVPVPRHEDQEQIAALDKERLALDSQMASGLVRVDELFASLQHRAFRGEL